MHSLKLAQVWVETAVYTLIGLTVIAIILATALPQIEKIKDRALVEQTITALDSLDKKISEAEQSSGNVRSIDFKVSKGKLEVDGENDEIRYVLEDTGLKLSEEDTEVKQGNLLIVTQKTGSKYMISLKMKYEKINITYQDGDNMKTFNAGPSPYKIIIENKDSVAVDEKIRIDFNVI
jgi:type II secretory pathway pseudopilin PulG